MYIEQIIASRLKALRTHFGYSIETMANITGYRIPDYYYLENTPSVFGAETVKHLCKQLNCSADYLLGLSDSISPLHQEPIHDPLLGLCPANRDAVKKYINFLLAQQEEIERIAHAKDKEA